MNDPQQPDGSGWSAAKVLGLILGLILMVGFGICGLCGLVMSVEDLASSGHELQGIWAIALPMGLGGIGVAIGGLFLVRKILRAARGRR